mmetsp:Transcript_8958/g.18610  ORF Transcript_8958/g.18610 Transcript_8958/m.18610 type:complete len:244 (-) Transcript_8958:108-839(-)
MKYEAFGFFTTNQCVTKYNLEVDLNSRAHGRLDVNATNILPLLLQETGEKVSSELSVDNDILLIHANISDSNVKAHNLLHLELDGSLNFIDLRLHIVTSRKKSGEFSCLGKTRTKKTRNLLDHVLGCHEEIIPLSELFDEFLVLVQFLQVFDTHVLNTDTIGLFAVSSITKNTTLEVGAGNCWKLEGTGETLVTDRIVVFQRNLGFNSFHKVALLSGLVLTVDANIFTCRVGKDVSNGLVEEC